MKDNKILNSVLGALVGALAAMLLVAYADISLFGDKSNVFLPLLVGLPVGCSLGYTFSLLKQWKLAEKIIMVVGSSIIGSLFSFVIIYVGLTISEKYVGMLFILQSVGVIGLTNFLGSIISKIFNNKRINSIPG